MKDFRFRGKNTIQIQLENRSTLLRLLRENEYACRKDLAEMSGLTGATVTNLIRDLINIGLVSEARDYSGTRIRNSVPLKMNYENFLIIGVSLRRGFLSLAVSDLSGMVIEKQKLVVDFKESVQSVLNVICGEVQNYIDKYQSKGKIIGLGLSLPGPLNLKKGEIPYLTNFPGWKDVQVKKILKNKFKLPLIIDDVANAAAIAEKWFGQGRKYHNIISILVSRGVGAGVILDEKIYHGAFGFAGEIGHVSIDFHGPKCECGNHGCLELYCSILTLLKKAQEIYGVNIITGFEDLTERVKNGDKNLCNLIVDNGKYLGYAVVNLVNIFNPELIVLHGDMTRFGDLWLDSIKETDHGRLLSDIYSNLLNDYSSVQEDPYLLGTVAMVCDYIFYNPQLKHFKIGDET